MIKIDKLIRSKRKSLGLEITPDARLIIRAPHRISLDDIQKIIFKKRGWIETKQKVIKEKCLKAVPTRFENREEFLYLGKNYPLVIRENAQSPLSFDKEFRLMRKHLPFAKRLFIDWYREKAYDQIKERLDCYANLLHLKYNKFGISNAKRRWGSCNSKGSICICWRLIMAPLHVIDYVVVHELTHLAERNHSQKFWDRVAIMYPAYKVSRKWLKENGYLLALDD